MSWEEILFGSKHIEIIDGDRSSNYPKQEELVDDGIPFLNTTNIVGNRFDFTNVNFITEDKFSRLRKGKLKFGDLVLTTKGSIGNIARWGDHFETGFINAQMLIIRADNVRVCSKFLYHLIASPQTQDILKGRASGVAQPQLPIRDLKSIKLKFPDIETQRKIAAILSAYDDLIENNLKRIALLEEAARQLYKEWFVRLRFPGHEHTCIVDGVPEGWERKPLAALCESINYGYTASAQQEDIGPKFLRITDIVPSFIDWPSVPHCEVPENKKEQYLLKEGDIVVARTGATVGYAKRLHKKHPETVFASYLVRLRLKPEADNVMLGVLVESEEYKKYIQAHVSGAAQPNANAKVIAGAPVLLPPKSIQDLFRETVEATLDQRELLQIQNSKLKQARDLLLPRLMSGEIPV